MSSILTKIQARHYRQGRLERIALAVVHDMEWAEKTTTAEDCAHMFATMGRVASAHVCIDADSEVRCVEDRDTAFAAPRANARGLHAELAGFARQSREEWLDPYSMAVLTRAAGRFAVWCRVYNLPVRKLTPAQVRAGEKGICGHWDVTLAFPGSGSHTDPGKDFPWDVFIPMVEDAYRGEPGGGLPDVATWRRVLAYVTGRRMLNGSDVKAWQTMLRARGHRIEADGVYGPRTAAATEEFQRVHSLIVTGEVDQATWNACLAKLAV